jgi:3-dehydroquinate synthase
VSEINNIYWSNHAIKALQDKFDANIYGKLFILVDSHTHQSCLHRLLAGFTKLPELEILEVEPGEESKSAEVLFQLWQSLSELEADRHSLLLNLGGGVITDLGGFLGSTYMRGIDYAHFPTSLLAMVDAAIGGKTGVNLGGYKNRVGSFSESVLIGLVPEFLESLPQAELFSGYAEMLKHGLIANENHFWNSVSNLSEAKIPEAELIGESQEIKLKIVGEDRLESGLRKVLNFGHTAGHALESISHQQDSALSHGHAIALGMQIALLISQRKTGLDPAKCRDLIGVLKQHYPMPSWRAKQESFFEMLKGDKKNRYGHINMVLLTAVGKPVFDQQVEALELWQAYEDILKF